MFEDFTFDQKGVKSGPLLDPLEPALSPKDVPTDWSPPQPAPATTRPTSASDDHPDDSESMDTIIQQMSRQTLLPYKRSDGRHRVFKCIEHAPIQWSTPNNIPPVSIPAPCPPSRPSCELDLPPQKLAAEIPGALDGAAKHPTAAQPCSSMQPRHDPDPQNSTCSPRVVREALMEMMITRGVQCNIQSLPPPPPPPASSTEPTFSLQVHGIDGNGDQSMTGAHTSQEPLEAIQVDEGYREEEEDDAMFKAISLRQAGMPGGIRRSGQLRFPSAAEAAMRTKNLKRNNLKMRKRSSKPKLAESAQLLTPPPEVNAVKPLSL